MNNRPQTIQIFLPDGSPMSIKEAEITNRLVKAIMFPRNKFQEVAKREMVHYTGVYFLFGNSEKDAKPLVYIGESEDCYERLRSHNREKEFWTHAVIVSAKTNEYNKTDGKFLEYHCLQKAIEIGRYSLVNDQEPKKPSILEPREYDLLDNFETIKLLLATLGYSLFEEKRIADSKEFFYCKGKDADAMGEMIDEGFLVMKDSVCHAELSDSAVGTWVEALRSKLLDSKILVEKNGVLVFQDDYILTSPSGAAACVLGRHANGWIEWKDKSGKSLDEIKRK